MSDAFIGEIRLFSGSYAPNNWAICDGSMLPINNNEALFSLIGTTYGGDGQSSFALPDLRGRLPVGQGSGPRLSLRTVGQQFGSETVTLTAAQLPQHNHPLVATTASATTSEAGNHLFADSGGDTLYGPLSQSDLNTMNTETVISNGGNLPHNNIMASLAMNYIICINGLYPSRN